MPASKAVAGKRHPQAALRRTRDSGSLSLKSQRQRQRRVHLRARVVLQRAILASVRVGIFPLTSYTQLPEVARMRWLVARCRELGCTRELSAATLVIDCAARSPLFTAAAAKVLAARKGQDALKQTAALVTLHRSRRWPSFWRGHASCIVSTLRLWSPAAVLRVGQALAAAGQRARATRALEELRSLRGVGSYLSLGMFRLLMAALSVGPRGTSGAAASMSDHVELLVQVLPFSLARGSLMAGGVADARGWKADFLAYLFCEVAKVLRHDGVLRPLSQYRGKRSLLETDLLSSRARGLLEVLETAMSGAPEPVTASPEILETARILKLPRHDLVQVQSLSVYKRLCSSRTTHH